MIVPPLAGAVGIVVLRKTCGSVAITSVPDGATTVTDADVDTAPDVAVMLTVPAATPVTTPPVTVATEALLVDHVNVTPEIVTLDASFAVATIVVAEPAVSDETDVGASVIDATVGATTVTNAP
jgi:hypothetical protein